ncbi:MAG: alanyl-tRNA editing protein [Candidatus Woesearchaeota archaeon]
MTELLFHNDAYQKKFEATITDVDGNWVALDKTAFYPTGGGQPCDTGVLETESGSDLIVAETMKQDGVVWHRLVNVDGVKPDMKVTGQIDWTRRHWFMRIHTASHVLSRLLIQEAGVSVSGNNLSSEKARIDFTLEDFDKEYMQTFEKKTNELLAKDLPVKTEFLSREEAAQEKEVFTLLKELPESIKQIRVVQVGEDPVIDRSACGGTHLNRTGEVGKVKFLKLENKGSQRRRISFTLE